MKINVFDIKFKTNPNQPIVMTKEPFVLDVPDSVDINSYIASWFEETYNTVPTFDWELLDDDNTLDDQYPSVDDFAEEIRHLLRRYFECDDNGSPNAEYDPEYTAQDCIDEIRELIGKI